MVKIGKLSTKLEFFLSLLNTKLGQLRLFSANIKIYLCFLSLLNTKLGQLVKIYFIKHLNIPVFPVITEH